MIASLAVADARLYRKSYGKEPKSSYLGHALVESRNGPIAAAREPNVTPHVTKNDKGRRATGHAGYAIGLSRRWLAAKGFWGRKQTGPLRQVKRRGLEKVAGRSSSAAPPTTCSGCRDLSRNSYLQAPGRATPEILPETRNGPPEHPQNPVNTSKNTDSNRFHAKASANRWRIQRFAGFFNKFLKSRVMNSLNKNAVILSKARDLLLPLLLLFFLSFPMGICF